MRSPARCAPTSSSACRSEADARAAEVLPPPPPGEATIWDTLLADPEAVSGRAFLNPPRAPDLVNARAWRAAEIPAANGHTSARGVARVYAALARGGELDGVRLLAPATIERAIEEQSRGRDAVLDPAHALRHRLHARDAGRHLRLRTRPAELRPPGPRRLDQLRGPGRAPRLRLRDQPVRDRHREASRPPRPPSWWTRCTRGCDEPGARTLRARLPAPRRGRRAAGGSRVGPRRGRPLRRRGARRRGGGPDADLSDHEPPLERGEARRRPRRVSRPRRASRTLDALAANSVEGATRTPRSRGCSPPRTCTR